MEAYLVLDNGLIFTGQGFGSARESFFPLCMNTSACGYTEIITHPAYNGRGIVFSYPLIGNYGVCREDYESPDITAGAVIVSRLSDIASNFRSEMSLNSALEPSDVPGIQGVDTRALVRILRDRADVFAMLTGDLSKTSGSGLTAAIEEIKNFRLSWESKDSALGSAKMRSSKNDAVCDDASLPRIHFVDLGCPAGFRKCLSGYFRLAEDSEGIAGVIIAGSDCINKIDIEVLKPFLSSKLPVLAVDSGHLALGLASGGVLKRLVPGHHGSGSPVRNLITGRAYITSQAHDYCLDRENLPENMKISWENINDNSIEGLNYIGNDIISTQFYPSVSGAGGTGGILEEFSGRINNAV